MFTGAGEILLNASSLGEARTTPLFQHTNDNDVQY